MCINCFFSLIFEMVVSGFYSMIIMFGLRLVLHVLYSHVVVFVFCKPRGGRICVLNCCLHLSSLPPKKCQQQLCFQKRSFHNFRFISSDKEHCWCFRTKFDFCSLTTDNWNACKIQRGRNWVTVLSFGATRQKNSLFFRTDYSGLYSFIAHSVDRNGGEEWVPHYNTRGGFLIGLKCGAGIKPKTSQMTSKHRSVLFALSCIAPFTHIAATSNCQIKETRPSF